MRVFRNLFGDGSKIHASEIAYKDLTGTIRTLDNIFNNIPRINDGDANNFPPGVVYAGNGNANTPGVGDWLFILTVLHSDTRGIQLGVFVNRNETWVRRLYGSWGSWYQLN